VGDRGFQDAAFKLSVKEILGKSVDVLHPVTKTHGQATVEDANASRIISSFRACVEQANANLKKSKLLTDRAPLHDLSRLGDWLALAAGIVNLIFVPLYAVEDGMELDGTFCNSVQALPIRQEPKLRRTSGKHTAQLRQLVSEDRELWNNREDLPLYSEESDDIEAALNALAPVTKKRTNPRLEAERTTERSDTSVLADGSYQALEEEIDDSLPTLRRSWRRRPVPSWLDFV